MSISFRHYLFADDGSLRRLPQRIVDELPTGRDAIPEFASTRQRVVCIVLENAEGRPRRILDARGEYWTFDDQGRVDRDMNRRMAELIDRVAEPVRARRGPVVDLVPELKKREHQARNEWTLTADDLDRIAADLWPGVHGPAPDVSSVKGKAPKKPPLTQEARWALQKLNDHVNAIKNELGSLSERALKGLAFEAVRSSMWEDETLWRGVADEARRLEAIRAAHRTGRGEWYAVIEVAREPGVRLPLGARHGGAREVLKPQGSGRSWPPADGRENRPARRRHGGQRERSLGSGMEAGRLEVVANGGRSRRSNDLQC